MVLHKPACVFKQESRGNRSNQNSSKLKLGNHCLYVYAVVDNIFINVNKYVNKRAKINRKKKKPNIVSCFLLYTPLIYILTFTCENERERKKLNETMPQLSQIFAFIALSSTHSFFFLLLFLPIMLICV
jgi:hypothetical protein